MKIGISFYNSNLYYVIINKKNELMEHGILKNFNLGNAQEFLKLCSVYCVNKIIIVEPIDKMLNKKHNAPFNTFIGLITFLKDKNISYFTISNLDVYNFFRCSHAELPSIINSLYNNINGDMIQAIRWGECIACIYNEQESIGSIK